jgi:hypothetical protein
MAARGKPFEKGNKLAKGGSRPNSGRRPGWLQEVCDAEMGNRKIAELRARIAAGETIVTEFTNPATGKLERIMRVPTLKDMQEAADWLADRAQGKAPQSIKHSGTAGIDLVSLIRQAEDERGLDPTV